MRRLYFVAQSMDDAESLVVHLQQKGVSEWRIHGLSYDDAGLYHHHIHPAHLFQRYDLVHLGERGAIVGFLAGLLWATAAHSFPVVPGHFGLAGTAFTVIVFTMFGAWSGGLVGITRIHYRMARFQRDLDLGACLIFVDVPRCLERELRDDVATSYKAITTAGSSSTFTNPLASGPD